MSVQQRTFRRMTISCHYWVISNPQSNQTPWCWVGASKLGTPARLRCRRCCRVACARLLQTEPRCLQKGCRHPWGSRPTTSDSSCSPGSRTLGRNRRDVLFLLDDLQTLGLSLSGHKRRLCRKEAKYYRQLFAKNVKFPC